MNKYTVPEFSACCILDVPNIREHCDLTPIILETYFAHPYHSWERGLNENHNGLIRQYLPKAQPLDKVTKKQVIDIQTRLNQRPRKLLGYKTPEEVYKQMKMAS